MILRELQILIIQKKAPPWTGRGVSLVSDLTRKAF